MKFQPLPAKILTFVSQPLVLALFALLLSLLLAPRDFPRHKLKLVQSGTHSDPFRNSEYVDLNGDGVMVLAERKPSGLKRKGATVYGFWTITSCCSTNNTGIN